MVGKIIKGTECINCAESVLGDFTITGKTLIIPMANLYLQENQDPILKDIGKNYINHSALIFTNIILLTWDYESSRNMNRNTRTCIGGELCRSGNYSEFWIEFESGYIFLPFNFEKSKSNFPIPNIETLNNLTIDLLPLLIQTP